MAWSVRVFLYQDGHLDKAHDIDTIASAGVAHEIFAEAVSAAEEHYDRRESCTRQ